MRPGFPYLPFFKAGRNAGVVPDLPCQCVGDGGHPTGNLLLVDEDADKLLASEVRQAVKDQLVDNFIYASVSPTYLAGVIDTL